jgi:ATP-binding cassette subfamily F protein uup
VGYLRGFLFSAKRALTPVRALSGGERNRVLLARLFVQPANLLVLDEPTNDLDVETLEVLEAQLARYSGTLIVVSHDRAFLDNVVSSVLVFEKESQIRYHVGGYSDWARRGQALATVDDPQQVDKRAKSSSQGSIPVRSTAKKLTYKLQHELEGLPDHIEELENKVSELQSRIAIQGFYQQPFTDTQPVLDELEQQSAALDQALARWSELEDIRAALEAAS